MEDGILALLFVIVISGVLITTGSLYWYFGEIGNDDKKTGIVVGKINNGGFIKCKVKLSDNSVVLPFGICSYDIGDKVNLSYRTNGVFIV